MATTRKQKNASARVSDRPFDRAILRQAEQLVKKYQVIVGFDEESNEYVGRGVELPNAVGFGVTADACMSDVRGNMLALVGYMLERGETPPLMAPPQRTLQLNVRVAEYEKETIEKYAAAAGTSVSDYLRQAALRAPHG